MTNARAPKPHSAAAREAARRRDGRFGTQSREEADVDLTDSPDVDASGTPISPAPTPTRAELAVAWALEGELMRTNETGAVIEGPAGYRIDVSPDSDDPGTLEGTGLIERGQYTAHQYNRNGEPTGAFMVCHFDDLDERRQASSKIAFYLALREREAGADFDEDPLAEARAEAAAEALYEAEAAAGTEPGTTPEPAGRYVDDPDSFWHGARIIAAYTREDALNDGALIDHSALAREAGITWPVALTAAAQADTVSWNDSNAGLQDETGRAWDVMWMASRAIKAHAQRNPNGSPGDRIPFTLLRVPNNPRATQPRSVELHAVLTAGDNGEPCWTITLPDED